MHIQTQNSDQKQTDNFSFLWPFSKAHLHLLISWTLNDNLAEWESWPFPIRREKNRDCVFAQGLIHSRLPKGNLSIFGHIGKAGKPWPLSAQPFLQRGLLDDSGIQGRQDGVHHLWPRTVDTWGLLTAAFQNYFFCLISVEKLTP